MALAWYRRNHGTFRALERLSKAGRRAGEWGKFQPWRRRQGGTFGVAVKSGSQIKTLKDLIDYAKANPERVLYGLSGRGLAGDVYELERDRDGPHGRIMKYNLNRA